MLQKSRCPYGEAFPGVLAKADTPPEGITRKSLGKRDRAQHCNLSSCVGFARQRPATFLRLMRSCLVEPVNERL